MRVNPGTCSRNRIIVSRESNYRSYGTVTRAPLNIPDVRRTLSGVGLPEYRAVNLRITFGSRVRARARVVPSRLRVGQLASRSSKVVVRLGFVGVFIPSRYIELKAVCLFRCAVHHDKSAFMVTRCNHAPYIPGLVLSQVFQLQLSAFCRCATER